MNKTIPVRMPTELWEKFKIKLIQNNTSAQQVLLKAVEEYVEKEAE